MTGATTDASPLDAAGADVGTPENDGQSDSGAGVDASETCAADAFCDNFERDAVRGAWSDLLDVRGDALSISRAAALSPSRSLRLALSPSTGGDAVLKRAFYESGTSRSSFHVSSAWLEIGPRPAVDVPILGARANVSDGTLIVDAVIGADGLRLVDERYDNATQTTSARRSGPAVLAAPDSAWHRVALTLDVAPPGGAAPRARLEVDGAEVDARELSGNNAPAQGEVVVGCYACPAVDYAVHYDDTRVRAVP